MRTCAPVQSAPQAGGRFVDPPHDPAAVDGADPVGVGRGGAEAHGAAGGGACRGVAFGGHGGFDACAHPYPHSCLAVPLQFKHGDRCPTGYLDRVPGVVDGDENDCALRGLNRLGTGEVTGVDGDENVHAAAPGVDEAGVQFDEFTHADGPVEVNVADAGGDAGAATPLCGDGVGGLVDPFEQRAAVDGADVAGVSRSDEDAVNCLVALGVWWRRRLGALGRMVPVAGHRPVQRSCPNGVLCGLHLDRPPLPCVLPSWCEWNGAAGKRGRPYCGLSLHNSQMGRNGRLGGGMLIR